MSGIQGRNTQPELFVRKGLFALGYRYRLHRVDLPGRPDIVFSKRRAVIFVNGCFWHGHDCHLFKLPSTRTSFWRAKIDGNRARDLSIEQRLSDMNWRQFRVWECALKGRQKLDPEAVIRRIADWIESSASKGEIKGAD